MAQDVKIIDIRRSYIPIDPNEFPITEAATEGEDRPEGRIPIIPYDGYNFMPTEDGYSSFFGVNSSLNIATLVASGGTGNIDDAFVIQTDAFHNIFVALCDDGIWTKDGTTVGNWTHVVVLGVPGGGVHKQWSKVVLENEVFVYRQSEANIWRANSGNAWVFTGYVPTFLNMAGQLGIFKAGGRLGTWDSLNSTAWAVLGDPTIFDPDVETLAGNTIFQDIAGKIVVIHQCGTGFIVYCTKSIVHVRRNTSSPFLFEGTAIFNNNGISYREEVCFGEPDTTHYAITTDGFVTIKTQDSPYSTADVNFEEPAVSTYLKQARKPVMLKLLNGRYLAFQYLDDRYNVGRADFITVGGIDYYNLAPVDARTFASGITTTFDSLTNFGAGIPGLAFFGSDLTRFVASYDDSTMVITDGVNAAPRIWRIAQDTGATIFGQQYRNEPNRGIIGVDESGNAWTDTTTIIFSKFRPSDSLDAILTITGGGSFIDHHLDLVQSPYEVGTLLVGFTSLGNAYVYSSAGLGLLTQTNIPAVGGFRPGEFAKQNANISGNIVYCTALGGAGNGFGKINVGSATFTLLGTVAGGRESTQMLVDFAVRFYFHEIGASHIYQYSTGGVLINTLNIAGHTISFGSITGADAGNPLAGKNYLWCYEPVFGGNTNWWKIDCDTLTIVASGTVPGLFVPGFGTANWKMAIGSRFADQSGPVWYIQTPARVFMGKLATALTPYVSPKSTLISNSPILLQIGSIEPVYPTFLGAFVLDIHYKKWGKMKQSYKRLLDFYPVNNVAGDSPIPYDSFLPRMAMVNLNGIISVFDQYPADAQITYGKHGLYRKGFTDAEEIRAKHRTPLAGFIKLETSIDGININSTLTVTNSFPGGRDWNSGYKNTSGRWYNITIGGNFDIVALEFRGRKTAKR